MKTVRKVSILLACFLDLNPEVSLQAIVAITRYGGSSEYLKLYSVVNELTLENLEEEGRDVYPIFYEKAN